MCQTLSLQEFHKNYKTLYFKYAKLFLDIKIAYYVQNMDVKFSTVYTISIVLAKITKKPKTCNYQNTSLHKINAKIGSQTQFAFLGFMQQ